MQLGQNDPDTRLWHDRATVYVALQKRLGASAVASDVARTLPPRNAIPTASYLPESYPGSEDEPTRPGAHPANLLSPTPIVTSNGHERPRPLTAPRRGAQDAPLPAFDLPQSRPDAASHPANDAVTARVRNVLAPWTAYSENASDATAPAVPLPAALGNRSPAAEWPRGAAEPAPDPRFGDPLSRGTAPRKCLRTKT